MPAKRTRQSPQGEDLTMNDVSGRFSARDFRPTSPTTLASLVLDCPSAWQYIPEFSDGKIATTSSHSTKRGRDYCPRPPNGFFLYKSFFIYTLRQSLGKARFSLVSNLLSRDVAPIWHALPGAEKELFNHTAQLIKERHTSMHPHYKYVPANAKKNKRQQPKGKAQNKPSKAQNKPSKAQSKSSRSSASEPSVDQEACPAALPVPLLAPNLPPTSTYISTPSPVSTHSYPSAADSEDVSMVEYCDFVPSPVPDLSDFALPPNHNELLPLEDISSLLLSTHLGEPAAVEKSQVHGTQMYDKPIDDEQLVALFHHTYILDSPVHTSDTATYVPLSPMLSHDNELFASQSSSPDLALTYPSPASGSTNLSDENLLSPMFSADCLFSPSTSPSTLADYERFGDELLKAWSVV